MHEGSNSLRPYNYRETSHQGEISYQFTTTTGIEYSCYFLDASGYFESYPAIAHNVVTFGFRITKAQPAFRQQYDVRIRDTIFDILYKSILRFPERSVFVMFDTRDCRSRHRKVTFGRWFKEFCRIYRLRITKLSLTVPCEDVTLVVNVCMFVPPGSPDLTAIKHAFVDLRDELISKGYPPTTEYECNG